MEYIPQFMNKSTKLRGQYNSSFQQRGKLEANSKEKFRGKSRPYKTTNVNYN